MSKEKQIEEMDAVIRDAVNGCSSYWSGLIADALYEEGYRKQSENLIEVVQCCDCKHCEVVIDSIIDEPKYFCTRMVGSIPIDPTDYCSRAKMKGGAE